MCYRIEKLLFEFKQNRLTDFRRSLYSNDQRANDTKASMLVISLSDLTNQLVRLVRRICFSNDKIKIKR